jgi:site-specific DNA-cytosine methylase
MLSGDLDAAVMMSGACGSSIGARQGGARVVWAANHVQRCIDMHDANFPTDECESVCQDLHLFNHAKMARHELLLASPVCRVNSSASRPSRAKAAARAKQQDPTKRKQGSSLASSHNSMGALPWAVMDALEVNRPRYFALENVTEWASEWPLYDLFIRMLRRLGYKITQQTLDASAFALDELGRTVPQQRERLFVIGTLGRKAIRVRQPKRPAQWKPTPVLDFIDWEGGDWQDFAEAGGDKFRAQLERAHQVFDGGPAFVNTVEHRPIYDARTEPLRTMTTQDQYRWVYRGKFKYPTAREGFSIMGFPDDFKIPEHIERRRTTAWAMAGDAVSPPVMRDIVQCIRDSD